jgi:hypothetical protein
MKRDVEGCGGIPRRELPMRDGLPKLKDFPKEFSGSGEIIPE